MRIVMLGINHRTAPVELRERLALAEDDLTVLLQHMRSIWPHAECVVLSTCNRMEFYIARPTHEPPAAEDLRRLMSERSGVSLADVTAATIHREQDQALTQLFRVCSGLDSMVLGEPQVLGQVKRAYDAAVQQQTVGPILHRVFQQAIAAGKHVRTTTGIDAGRVSVGSVAADFARQVFEDFSDKVVLGIGAGEMAEAALSHLRDLRPQRLWLCNRSPQRAADLAGNLAISADSGGARAWDELDELLVEADIVLSSTGAREPILTVDRLAPLARRRRNRPLFIIDLAVPRDVSPEVGAMKNVYLYNIDDLQTVVQANMDERREQVHQCEAHLADAVAACMRQVQARDIGQLIRQLRHRLQEIGEAEQNRTVRKLLNINGGAAASAEEVVAEHTHRLINKILHVPLSQLEKRHDDQNAPLAFYAAALRRLFDLEDEAVADKPPRPAAPLSPKGDNSADSPDSQPKP